MFSDLREFAQDNAEWEYGTWESYDEMSPEELSRHHMFLGAILTHTQGRMAQLFRMYQQRTSASGEEQSMDMEVDHH